MKALSAAELLDTWERGRSEPPPVRALRLLAAARPDADAAELEQVTVGRRDAALLALREAMFGPRLVGLASCPSCGEQVEAAFDCAEVRREPAALECDDPFRLPTCADLVAIAGEPDVATARERLLRRCLADPVDASEPEDVAALVRRMAEADAQADVELALVCPACGREWAADLDIAAFLWDEVRTRATRTLHDVHVLASAYGWSERAILELTPARRRAYLRFVEQ
jgi:hypothetical protein